MSGKRNCLRHTSNFFTAADEFNIERCCDEVSFASRSKSETSSLRAYLRVTFNNADTSGAIMFDETLFTTSRVCFQVFSLQTRPPWTSEVRYSLFVNMPVQVHSSRWAKNASADAALSVTTQFTLNIEPAHWEDTAHKYNVIKDLNCKKLECLFLICWELNRN